MTSFRGARLALLLGAVICTAAIARAAELPAQPRPPASVAATPLDALPYVPGVDPASLDRSVDPCEDFYAFACGGWIRANPIPADKSSWDAYGAQAEDNRRFLWGILQRLSAPDASRTPAQRKIGDYFAACMDEAAIERKGSKPLDAWLASIDAVRDARGLAPLLARMHRDLGPGNAMFDPSPGPDFEDSTREIAFVDASGLGLPDRDYYFREDEESRRIREAYVAHVARALQLAGRPQAVAQREALVVMDIETALARASMTRVERRDPRGQVHKLSLAELEALAPHFDWRVYFAALDVPLDGPFNVNQPLFVKALDRAIAERGIEELRIYLRWHAVDALSPYLSRPFVEANFDFYERTLNGTPALPPRWKRCVRWVDAQLGEALGQEFVRAAFAPATKERVRAMAAEIKAAMREEIESLDWMDAATRLKAQAKLAAVVDKIGYPDRWRDYGSVRVARDDFAGDVQRATAFETDRQVAKIGKPVDRSEWFMTPPTVNAYYSWQFNDINFPAGVLQPPAYDPRMDDAPNYGNTGGTIGHELTHGFDDQGRHFDGGGNLVDWWSARDSQQFEARAACVDEQFAGFVAVDDLHLNGKLTLGENIADLGGLLLAWKAWESHRAPGDAPRDGLTPAQRFFVGFAAGYCESLRPEFARTLAQTDPHAPGRFRANGVVSNMPQFARAFGCRPGQPMVRPEACKVW